MPSKPLCSRCRKELKPRISLSGQSRVYDVCPDCEAELTRQLKGTVLEKFLDTLGSPALVVNEDMRVIAYNQSCFQQLCGMDPKPKGLLAGEFLDCHNAASSKRCGATPNCLDCAIRLTAINTFQTGTPQQYVPAFLTGKDNDRKVERKFLISTDKIENMVQIKVEGLYNVLEPPSET